MFKYKAEDVINEKNLTSIISSFKLNELKHFNTLEKYYRVKNVILEREMADEKPNNKLAHGFAKYITNMATGYFIGKGLKYNIEDEDFNSYISDILEFNNTNNINFEIAKEAGKKGVAYEIMYIDEKAKLKTKKLKAEDVIPIYSPNLGEFLECAIRIWSEQEIDSDETIEYAELYTETEIITYKKGSKDKQYNEIASALHNLSDIPIIVYWNNEEQTSDFEDVISLIDAYDKAQSDTANDNEYFTDAYLLIVGAGGGISTADGDDDENQTDAYRTMRKERVLHLDEKGQAQWLIKNVNDTAVENYKDRLFKDIFFLSQVPALSDESFAGNLTGIALRYKTIGLEQLSIMKENKFLSAQKKKIKIMTSYINQLHNKSFDSSKVKIKSERNFIDNETEKIDNIDKLQDLLSKETLLEITPYVEDVKNELQRLSVENLKKERLPKIPKDYTFGSYDIDGDD